MDLLSKENITYIVIFIFIILSLTNLYNRVNSESDSERNSNLEAFQTIVEDQRINDITKRVYLPSMDTVQFATIEKPNNFESLGTKWQNLKNELSEVQVNVGEQIKTVNNNLTSLEGTLNKKVDDTVINVNKRVDDTVTNVNNKITDLQNNVIIKDSAGNVNINCPITNITSNVVIGSRTKSNTLVILGNENYTEASSKANTSKSTPNNGQTNNGSNSLVIGHMSVPLTQGNISISTSKWDAVGLPSFSTINTIGRMHITGTDSLYLLNKNGVNVSKAWGGNGNLTVDGSIFGNSIALTSATNEGAAISFNNPLKTGKKGLVDSWVIFNMTDQGPSEWKYANGLHFWKYGKELTYNNNNASQLLLRDDGISEFNSTLNVNGSLNVKGVATVGYTIEIANKVRLGTTDPQYPTATTNISDIGIQFGGPNANNSDGASASITITKYDNGALCIVGQTTSAGRRITMWAEKELLIYGPIRSGIVTCTGIYMPGKNIDIMNGNIFCGRGNQSSMTVNTIWTSYINCDVNIWSQAYQNLSDKRSKENIKNISQNEKDKVLQLVPKTYNFIKDEKKDKRYGLIAQEVEEIYPELISEDEKGMKSLNYMDLIPLLLEHIKDLKKSIPNQNVINTNLINIGGVTLTANDILKIKQLIN
jgi:hypothetical protein